MGNLSEHYNHRDFYCGCDACRVSKEAEYKIHLGLVGALELLWVKLNKPVRLKQSFRCESQNEKLGGGRKSFHLKGKAAHIYVEGMGANELFKAARDIPEIKGLGLNLDENTVHIDLRNEPERTEWIKERGKYIPVTGDKKAEFGL